MKVRTPLVNVVIWRYILGWFALVIMAIINGALREVFYKPLVGDLTAHQISTITGILLFALIIWGMSRVWPIPTAREAWTVGFIWLAMTVCFEFLFGHYVMGHPWTKLLHDYNVLQGRAWVAVLLWTVVAPYVFYRLSQRKA